MERPSLAVAEAAAVEAALATGQVLSALAALRLSLNVSIREHHPPLSLV